MKPQIFSATQIGIGPVISNRRRPTAMRWGASEIESVPGMPKTRTHWNFAYIYIYIYVHISYIFLYINTICNICIANCEHQWTRTVKDPKPPANTSSKNTWTHDAWPSSFSNFVAKASHWARSWWSSPYLGYLCVYHFAGLSIAQHVQTMGKPWNSIGHCKGWTRHVKTKKRIEMRWKKALAVYLLEAFRPSTDQMLWSCWSPTSPSYSQLLLCSKHNNNTKKIMKLNCQQPCRLFFAG